MNQILQVVKLFLMMFLIMCSMRLFSEKVVFSALRLSALGECPKAYGIAFTDELQYSDRQSIL